MSQASQSLSREDALLYLRRFPAQGIMAVLVNLLLVLASNAVVLWLLLHKGLSPAQLIALVIVETLLLIAIAWLQQRMVPRRDWLEQPKPWRERAPLIGFVLLWIGCAYGLTLAVLRGYGDLFALLTSLDAWTESRLHWSLLATLTLALIHVVGDHWHYRRLGGPFHSSVSHDAMARYLTLLLGGIPFAMPFFAVFLGGVKGIEFAARKARTAPQQSLLVLITMIVVASLSYALITRLVDSDVSAWAIGFIFAKLIAEAALACMPLVMAHVARHGP
jgi:hypothetical protein